LDVYFFYSLEQLRILPDNGSPFSSKVSSILSCILQ
jgi:hypothetical protein